MDNNFVNKRYYFGVWAIIILLVGIFLIPFFLSYIPSTKLAFEPYPSVGPLLPSLDESSENYKLRTESYWERQRSVDSAREVERILASVLLFTALMFSLLSLSKERGWLRLLGLFSIVIILYIFYVSYFVSNFFF